jgi:hypothetical protein
MPDVPLEVEDDVLADGELVIEGSEYAEGSGELATDETLIPPVYHNDAWQRL